MGTSLHGEVAVVTGATRGIGLAIASELARCGATVVAVGRDAQALERVARAEGIAAAMAADVTDSGSVDALFTRVREEVGEVDILVNNAGAGTFAPATELDPGDVRAMLDVNVMGTVLCTRSVLADMVERGRGKVLTVCSDVARRTFPGGSGYCASKHAQLAFVNATRAEVRAAGVQLLALLPGIVDTAFAGATPGEAGKEWMLQAQDVADAATFMLTRRPSVIVDELLLHPMAQEW